MCCNYCSRSLCSQLHRWVEGFTEETLDISLSLRQSGNTVSSLKNISFLHESNTLQDTQHLKQNKQIKSARLIKNTRNEQAGGVHVLDSVSSLSRGDVMTYMTLSCSRHSLHILIMCYQVSAVLTELAAVYKALLPQAVVTELGSVCSAAITQGASAFTQTLVKHKDVSDFCLMLHLLKDLESVHTRICPAWGQRRDKDTQNKSRRTKMTTDSWQEGDETQND